VGAALYVWHVLLGKPRQFTLENAYLGQEYDDERSRPFWTVSIGYEVYNDMKPSLPLVADIMGKVVDVSGRFEWDHGRWESEHPGYPRRADMKHISIVNQFP